MSGGLSELIFDHLLRAGVSPVWLLRSSSKMNARFRATAKVECAQETGCQIITINGVAFAWPKNVLPDELINMAGELEMPDHPHQYLWGPTKLQAGDVVLDIGSCEGGFSARAKQLGAEPIAIEPTPKMLPIIRRLFEVRNLASPRIIDLALGSKPGTLTLHEEPDNPGYARLTPAAETGAATVQVISLDEMIHRFNIPRVDFIKCDAEGADLDIIHSGEALLKRDRPKLAICTYHEHDHFSRLSSFLKPLGYRIRGKGLLRVMKNYRILMLHAS